MISTKNVSLKFQIVSETIEYRINVSLCLLPRVGRLCSTMHKVHTKRVACLVAREFAKLHSRCRRDAAYTTGKVLEDIVYRVCIQCTIYIYIYIVMFVYPSKCPLGHLHIHIRTHMCIYASIYVLTYKHKQNYYYKEIFPFILYFFLVCSLIFSVFPSRFPRCVLYDAADVVLYIPLLLLLLNNQRMMKKNVQRHSCAFPLSNCTNSQQT